MKEELKPNAPLQETTLLDPGPVAFASPNNDQMGLDKIDDPEGESAPTSSSTKSGGSSVNPRPIELLTGSREHLSEELDNILLSRLRITSLLLFSGYLAFLVYRLISPHQPGTLDRAILWTHVVMTIVTGGIGSRCCVGKRLVGSQLNLSELLVFGGSALFFLLFSLAMLLDTASRGFFASINGPWMLLLFTYALFIPSDWRRATQVIAPMALCPLLAMTIAWSYSEAFRRVLHDPQFRDAFPTTALSMALAAAIAIYGVHTIRSLRSEAFQARQLGQYRLTERLGAGGMGEVYLAEHLLLKRACAVKVIKPEKAEDAQVLRRFEREVRETAQLTHWNTVEIYDYGHTEDGTFYYVMEYLSGMNLQELVDQHGPLPEARVIHILTQACDGLGEAHASGLVHRDIKPANIFLAKLGRRCDVAKILDFGLVRPVSTTSSDVQLTQQNAIVGSPLFMAPEQAGGERPDVRSDIYSLGVVAYFLLSGRTPFEGSNPLEVLMAHARKPPPPLDPSLVSTELHAIVMRCLEKEPEDRFESADSLGEHLARCRTASDWSWEQAFEWWSRHLPA